MSLESRLRRAAQAKKAEPGASAGPVHASRAARPLVAWLGVTGALVLGACANEPPQQAAYVAQRPQIATADATPRRFAQPTDPTQDTALTKVPPKETAATLAKLAQRATEEGNLESATQLYRRSLALDPNVLPVTLGLAEVLYRADDFRSALETYRQAQRLDPANDEAMRGVGKTLIALDRPKEAIETYHKAAIRQPRDPRVFNGLGVGQDMAGDHPAAQQQYQKALSLAPDDPNVQNNLGLSLALSGNFTPSIEMLTRLVASPRATPRNRQNLALVYGLMGNEERAAYYARQDLAEPDVQRNLAYYAQLRASTDKARSAAAFGVDSRAPVPQLPAPDTMRPAAPRMPATSENQAAPALPDLAPASGTPPSRDLVPVPPQETPQDKAQQGAPSAATEAAAPKAAEPRKAMVVEAKPGTVEAEPSSLRGFLSKVLAAPTEPPATNNTVAAGDDPERSIEGRQPK